MVRPHSPSQAIGAGSSLASTLCRAWDLAFAAAVLGAGLVFADLLLAASFSKWDDEGYVLISLLGRNCDTLFTLHGMASFNVWSSVPPPTGWNMTAWMKAFDQNRQQRIFDVLKTRPSAGVIQNSDLMRFWQLDLEEVRRLPLGRYVLDHMPAVEERDGYVIRMHPRRTSPWISPTS